MHITQLYLNKIKPDPTQPRKTFSEDNLKGLAETIKKNR
ncbi:MAG: ParB N-terminal domain-containing protein [Methanosarcinales archaeon]